MRPRLPFQLVWAFCLALFLREHSVAQLQFIENQGQWATPYKLRAKLQAGEFWLKEHEAAVVLSDFGGDSHHSHKRKNESEKLHCYVMQFVGASPTATLTGKELLPTYHNYFLGKEENWRSRVALFAKASHKDLYPGVDLHWMEEKGNLKYEYHLKAGVNPNIILTRYKGVEKISLKNGALELKISLGRVKELKPVAYQWKDGRKVPVACQFSLKTSHMVGFQFPNGFDTKLPLVIDPVLIFSTYSGSRSDNWGFSATYGENGTAYSGGIVMGPRFPFTPGAFQPGFAGDSSSQLNALRTFDIGIQKFNASGTELLFATFLGGSQAEVPSSLVVDHEHNLVVLGATSSSDFPVTTGCFDNSYNGGQNTSPYGPSVSVVQFTQGSDLIISKFSANGTQLLGSTFLGGSRNDGIITLTNQGNSPLVKNYGDSFRGEVAVDSLNRIYIASNTLSTDFPRVQPIFNTVSTGWNAICARFNANLTNLEFSTILGGTGDDAAFSIQILKNGRICLAGGTASSNFPTSTGTLNPAWSGTVDGFLCTFTPGGGSASYRATFLGTPQFDQVYFVQQDRAGNLYVFGQTLGNYPVSAGVYANPNSSQFIHCLSPNLDSTRFSTVFGNGSGTTNIAPTAFLVDDCGRIYCSGWGGSTNNLNGYQNGNTLNMATTPDALLTTSDGSDFYMIVFDRLAQNLSFATYFGSPFGSEHVDGGTSRFDKKGVVYQSVCAGCGGSSSFPTTPGVYSPGNPSTNCNMAVFKYDFSLLKAGFQPSVTKACAPATILFSSTSQYATQYSWQFESGSTQTTNNDTISHTFTAAGTYEVKLIARNPDACPALDSIVRTIEIETVPTLTNDSLRFCSLFDTLAMPALPGGNLTYLWEPPTFLSNPTVANPTLNAPQSTTVYTAAIRSPFGCTSSAIIKVSNGILKAKAEAPSLKGCRPFSASFTNQSFQAKTSIWYWGDGDSTQTNEVITTHTFQNAGLYTVVLQVRNDTTCLPSDADTLQIEVFDLPSIQDTLNRICSQTGNRLKAGQNSGISYEWWPGQAFLDSTAAEPELLNATPGVYQVRITDQNGCRNTAHVELREGRIRPQFSVSASNVCVPTTVQLSNSSWNAQLSRWYWENDSAQVAGNGSVPISFSTPGRKIIRLRILSDTACVAFADTTQEIILGGIEPLPTVRRNFCPFDTVTLSVTEKPGYSYTWPSLAQVLANPATARVTAADSVQFSVTITDSLGCPGSQTFELIPSKPKADFLLNSRFDLCLDQLNYELQASTVSATPLIHTWLISDSLAFQGDVIAYTFPGRGEYIIRLIAASGSCRDTLLQRVDIQDRKLQLKADFEFMPELLGCNSLPRLRIKNTSVDADRYIWNYNEQSSFEEEPTIPITVAQNLKVSLTAYKELCSQTLEKEIALQPISPPNLLTANQDGKNDVFAIPNLPQGSRMTIINRWGKVIFESDNYQNNWAPPAGMESGFFELGLPNGEHCKNWFHVVK